jgi:hypothetical protein
MELRESPDPSMPFLDSVEGEIAFFRSIMRARPIGLHRHFHVLSIRTVIHQDTGQYVSIDDVWEKLRSCYNIEALENLVRFQKKKTPPIEKYTVRNDVLTFFLPPPLYSGRRRLRISQFLTFHTEHHRLTLSIR